MKDGWKVLSLRDCCDILDSKRVPITKSKREKGDVPYYGATGLQDYVKDFLFDEPLVLLGEDGAKWGAGENSAYKIDGKSWVNNHAHVLRPKRDLLKDEWLIYFLNYSDLQGYITGVTVPKLNQEKMGTIGIPVPSLSEQQSIVDYLDSSFAKIDAMKANAEKALGDAKALFQVALKDLLEPKDGWEEKALGEFAHMKAGDFVKASDIHSEYKIGLYPCFGGNGLRGYVSEPNQDGEYCLIGRQGALCGNVNLAKGVFRATEHAVVVKPYVDIPPLLTFYLLTRLNINQYATGAAQPGISVKVIEKTVMISIPPKEEWNTIVTTLDTIKSKVDKLQTNYDQICKECDALKQALLKQVFE